MKTEDLKKLGLEQEAINKIMEWNGQDINAEKEKTEAAERERDNYKSQLDTATQTLENFEDVDPESMQKTIDDLNQKLKDKDKEYADKEAERIFLDGLKELIRKEGGRNEKAVLAMLDLEALKQSKNQTEDAKKALDAVKESDAYLFGMDEPINHPVGPTNSQIVGITKEQFQKMGYKERLELKQSNPQKYKELKGE